MKKNESYKKLSLYDVKALDKTIASLKESIQESNNFTEKLKRKKILYNQSPRKEIKSTELTNSVSKEKIISSNNFSQKLKLLGRNSNKVENIQEMDNLYLYQTNPTRNTMNLDIEIVENYDESIENIYYKNHCITNTTSILKKSTPMKVKLEPIQTNLLSSFNKSPSNSIFIKNSVKIIIPNNNDRESKLIFSKILNKKYDLIKTTDKKLLERKDETKKDFTCEKQINEMKSKIHLIKEIYDYVYPKIMINKMKCITLKKKLDISKILGSNAIETQDSSSSNEKESYTKKKMPTLFTNNMFQKIIQIKKNYKNKGGK